MEGPIHRTVALSRDQSALLISSEYNERIRVIIRGFRGARWDRELRVWMVPTQHTAALLEQLSPFEFSVAPEISEAVAADPLSGEEPTLTITQLNQRIRAVLDTAFGEPIWVRGELFSFDRTATRRHWFFELIEKATDANDVAARISAVIFARSRQALQKRLERSGEELRLRDGLEVRLRGRIEYYPPSGRTQLVVDDIDPDYSLGQLAIRRLEILRTLSEEGLLARNQRLPWPSLPLRVGLITADGSDALHDFVTTLSDSPYAFQILHHPASVQGPNLEAEVLSALRYFEGIGAVDVVVIVRGGGSRSDLAWFDSLPLARQVASSGIKIVVGIGHERDHSVLDEVAAFEKTPTAAAEKLVALVSNEADELADMASRLVEQAYKRVENEWARVEALTVGLARNARAVLQRAQYQLDNRLGPLIQTIARGRIRIELSHQAGFAARLERERVLRTLRQPEARCLLGADRLRRSVRALFVEQDRLLTSLHARVSACDPEKTLARGYAIVRHAGAAVRESRDAPIGSIVDVQLSKGGLQATVNQHFRKSKP